MIALIVMIALWGIILVPTGIRVYRFLRTTRLAELKLRIVRVPRVAPPVVVSAERAKFDPAHWESVSPWCCRRVR